MSQRFIGSIDLTELGEAVRNQHSSITTGNNGKKYANVTIWLNDAPDQYGNQLSIQLNSKADVRETEAKVYVGRAKPPQPKQEAPAAPSSTNAADDLPF